MLNFLIHRPIAVFMCVAGIVVLGLLTMQILPISLLPDVPIPQITVQIEAPNKDPRTLEKTVVSSLRQQLLQVNHLENIQSVTWNGAATITLDFAFGTNTNLAFIEVNEKMDQVMKLLPKEQQRPSVIQANVSDLPRVSVECCSQNTGRANF